MKPSILAFIKKLFNLDTLVSLDFETYYKSKASNGTKSFSLTSKTYAEYIFGEEFQITGLAIAEDCNPFEYVHTPEDVLDVMDEFKQRREDGERIGIVAHNTQFDASITNWVHQLNFDAYLCTKLLSTLLYPNLRSSLKYAAAKEWPDKEDMQKGGEELVAVDGIRYEYITEQQHEALGKYAIQDAELCRSLLSIYVEKVIEAGLINELRLMHITLRGCIEPQFMIDRELLFEVIEDEERKKDLAFHKANEFVDMCGVSCTPKTFSSNPQYAKLLEDIGVTVPLKISPTTGQFIPAVGKNDPEYTRLQIDNPEFADVFDAREKIKSTISASRAERMINVADMFYENGFKEHPDMPFFLNYMGAKQTGRWSGGQKLNQQNNTRGGKHRLSMLAPEHYVIAVCDLSNIELRVNMWLCGQTDVLDRMETDPEYDYYCDVAEGIFNKKVTKGVDKNERQMGKASGLGLGFAMGWRGFQGYLASGPLGMAPMFKPDSFCKDVKMSYDAKHDSVRFMWEYIKNSVIPAIVLGGELRFGPNNSFVANKDEIRLPSGRVLKYANARFVGEETQNGMNTKVVFDSDKYDRFGTAVLKYMWHGLILENMVQATARDVMGEQITLIESDLQTLGYGWVMGSVHDETLNAVREDAADAAFNVIESRMSTPPEWASDIPLACEGGYAREYSK